MSPEMLKLFGRRRYLHFDEPIPPYAAHALATNPGRVSKWGFMPFIRCDIVTRKVKRVEGKLVTKKKVRPICYAAHKDAAIYAYYCHLLSCHYEQKLQLEGLSQQITAFRPGTGKCNIDFALEAFSAIKRYGDCVALAFDVEGFFDTLDHQILKQQWCALLGVTKLPDDHFAVYRSLTRFAYVDREKSFRALGVSPNNPRAFDRQRLCSPDVFRKSIRGADLIQVNKQPKGIPQGSPASAVLSNFYMLTFDRAVAAFIASNGGFYRRYCDDILCVVPNSSAQAVENFVMAEIDKLKLTINSDKTKRHTFVLNDGKIEVEQPLQYLGFLFDGKKTVVRTASVARYYAKLRAGVRFAALTKMKFDRIAESESKKNGDLRTRKLNIRYSYLGRHNFVSYSLRAARKMDEPAIRQQIKRHWNKLQKQIRKELSEPSNT